MEISKNQYQLANLYLSFKIGNQEISVKSSYKKNRNLWTSSRGYIAMKLFTVLPGSF